MTAVSLTGSYIVVSSAIKCLIQKTSCRSANSNFSASGTHVLTRTAQVPVLEITIFATACRFLIQTHSKFIKE